MLTTSNTHISGSELRKIISMNIFEKLKQHKNTLNKNNCIIAKISSKKSKFSRKNQKKNQKQITIKIQIRIKSHEKNEKSKGNIQKIKTNQNIMKI